jgi:hypothetical protein
MGAKLGLFELASDPGYYMKAPAQIARVYRAGRCLTLFFSMGVLLLVFLLGREVADTRVAYVAAFLWAICPLDIVMSHYLTPDVHLTFWVCLTLYGAIGICRSYSWPRCLLAAVAAVCAAGTKYSGITVWAALGMAHLLAPVVYGEGWAGRMRRFVGAKWWGGILLFGVLYLLLNPALLLSFRDFWRSGMEDALLYSVFTGHMTDQLRTGLGWIFYGKGILYYSLGFPLLLCVAGGLAWWLVTHRTREGGVVLFWGLVYFFLMGAAKTRYTRYMEPLVPLLVLAAARGLVGLPRYLGGRFGPLARWLCVGAEGLCVVYTVLMGVAFGRVFSVPDARDRASSWMMENIPSGEGVGILDNPEYAGCRRFFPLPPALYTSEKEEEGGYAPPYRRRLVPMRADALGQAPEWIVVTDYEIRNIIRMPEAFPEEARFLERLFGETGGYRMEQFFYVPPTAGIVRFPDRFPPHDWIYMNPQVCVFRKVKGL